MKSNHRQGKLSGMMAVGLTMLAIVVMFAGAAAPAPAQTLTTLHSFQNVSTDACEPEDNIVQGRDGNMYGVGVSCGTNNTGAVYKISPSGVESVIFNFPSNWSFCFSGLTLGSDGNFYGTCFTNPGGNGGIFRLTPAGAFRDLHDFTGVNGDTEPVYAPIQATDGNFYGTTGDYPFSCGNIYQLTAAGVYKNLHTFSGSDCDPLRVCSRPAMAIFMARFTPAQSTGPGRVACTRSAQQAFSKKFTASRPPRGMFHAPV